MAFSTLIFEVVPFLWRITLVRGLESAGKFRAARQKLAPIEAPDGYMCLKEAYDARLASIAYAANVTFEPLETHRPDELSRLILELQTHQWYCAPTTANERYAAGYIDYLETLLLGDADRRRELAQELDGGPADNFFKSVLLVT